MSFDSSEIAALFAEYEASEVYRAEVALEARSRRTRQLDLFDPPKPPTRGLDMERRRAWLAAYRVKNAERIQAQHRAYREANRDAVRERVKASRLRNPEPARAAARRYQAKRRAHQRGADQS